MLGLAVAYGGARIILSLAFPRPITCPFQTSPSLPVLGFAFLLSLVTGMVFGIVPAWITSHSDPAEALRGVNRTTRDRSSLPQKSLIVIQAALSVVLLLGAGLLTRSLNNLQHQDFGIQLANRYVVHVDPAGAGYTPEKLQALYQALEQQVRITVPACRALVWRSTARSKATTGVKPIYVEGHPEPPHRANITIPPGIASARSSSKLLGSR